MSAPEHDRRHHHLHVPGTSPVHRLAPEIKIVALVAFAVAVALTPRRAVPAFAIDAAVVASVVTVARLPVALVARRLLVITPFVAFAALVPFVAGGEQVEVFGVAVSAEGLWSAWGIVAKAALGATASIVLSATTPIPDVLRGLTRLRCPAVVVAIIAFMFRYLDLVIDRLRRMRIAMTARAHDPRWWWQARPIAGAAGVLFVRSYEQGERIHRAMASRGFTGSMPELDATPTRRRAWIPALVPAALAATGALIA